ncbi:carbamate kinase [Weissella oryzae SG25]|uniref:Carbamate kinase n=1 Tax=Weissella oryzae (strain DSM 25784 / JCM 18191 / LMG 30913 / SG25) TaxID=1329250 RepID=A0A069CWB4_WEIOS|nr:carbamate kinase [Weissella oryzae]GAK31518.1 carbamate kinase [Weissella oryzae SG25]
MVRRIVVALGGNAILTDDPSAVAQEHALDLTAEQLIPLIKNNDVEMVVTHGNGPQVGNLLLQQLAADSPKNPAMPLDTDVAMTEGQIGFWMSNAFTKALNKNGMGQVPVAAVVTRVVVDKNDQAFENPSKPIGPFYTEAEVAELKAAHPDWQMVEDAGRGYRRVVPSPKPERIVEAEAIKPMIAAGVLTTVSGGGGTPVIEVEDGFAGVEAVIDKDFSAAKLAELVEADDLLILTAVDNVFVNFNKPDQKKLEKVTIAEAEAYIAEGQFAKGSMLPKVQAAIEFVKRTGNPATITSLENVEDFIANGTGTQIIPG